MTNTPLTIKETQKGILEKDFSSVELVDTYLERIEKNKDLNAYITVCDEAAYKKAKEVDQLVKSGEENLIEKFPLLGVTVGHKDLFLTKGIRTTAGSKVLESYIPPYSATVVERMEKAGAVVLGKTNCDAWAHGASGENSDFGPAINPWDKDMVPGGSSSGSAASVAAGLSLVATGTDTGGSIRQPANFCGIVGLKPTYGAVPRYGVIAMASSLDSMGSFGKSVNEVETIFNVTRGEDGFDSTVKNTELFKPKSRMKIGIPKEYFVEGVDSEIADKVMEVSKVFEKTGIELVQISLPHTKYAISVYYIVQPAEVSSNLGRYDGIRYGNPRVSFGAEAKRRIMLIEDFEKAFNGVDAILAPVSPTPAFKIGEKAEDPLKMYLADIFTAPANLAGIPGLAMPSGFNKNKLPLGFQLLGPRFSEPVLFGLGKLYEDETNYKPGLPKL
ncbi:MAG: Glutamyl-tRNA(Gln) amidotransferase subunit A [Candidatus Woesebacteria bacterium GW2011_GWA1_41_7]|uniref:Glutamyl-tRNA(Gln) amidotransferase subunit A n=1 Tax=Candidatus Woesebacteria bacterium GW2011_GWA1_41_7 TaxID=1618556 RepID=A0A0G0ZS57_9BACT|nr:MAG: Glutamyl-tRNA(Gln) amidotransferase subunit A [Candidatus Woesebacteria bacterium GW2011_GWA1_41_7]